MLSRPWRIVVAVLAAAVVVVLLVRSSSAADGRWKVTAQFVDTTGLYVGNEVSYLGVPVGEITAIEPEGPTMRVEMLVDDDISVPRDAVAEVLQSALLTDRYVELGPAFTGGETLEPGSTIKVEKTRSPISFDDLARQIDALVVALDREGPDGRDIGDLVGVTARNLDGNGERIRRLIVSSRVALASINDKTPDLAAIAKDLDVLAKALGANDATVRRFTQNLSETSQVVAGQTESLDQTLRSLSALSTEVASFVNENRGVLKADLRDVAAITRTIRQQQDTLGRIFDYMPLGAENIARAFDPRSRSIRVEIAIREAGPFNALVRQTICAAVAGDLCNLLTNSAGTGPLDLLLNGLESQIPGGM
jgi:phospholipid/cholesterol/gamma-HCH transport system substrate-binding protein